MSNAHAHPWHRGSIFGEGPRHPLDRERRAVWKARLAMHERAGRITSDHEKIGEALLKRLGTDGRCDPSHATLAADTGKDVSTVKRALKAFHACGLVSWAKRIVRAGQRVVQTSNAYLLTLGAAPNFPADRCEVPSARQTLKDIDSSVQQSVPEVSERERREAQAAMAKRRAVVDARLLTRGAVART
jgi:hypothetical protein